MRPLYMILGICVFVTAIVLFQIFSPRIPVATPGASPSPSAETSIRVTTPTPAMRVRNPITVIGTARGSWFFEASFPITLIGEKNNPVAYGIAEATSDWMTEDFVPFVGEINAQDLRGNFFIELKKDNPSGEPQFDESIRIPIVLE